MVERIAEAVREDGVPVGAILALTFTEKAAGELAERLRRRLTELGERRARPRRRRRLDRHDPRLLRPPAALAAARRRPGPALRGARGDRRRAARERRLRATRSRPGRRADGAAAIDLAASYGPGLRELVQGAYATLRARGHARPRARRSRRAPPRPTRGAGRGAARGGRCATCAARRRRRRACARRRRDRAARRARELAASGDAVPWPGELDAAELKGGAKALTSDAVRGLPRARGRAYRAACADYHAQRGADAHRRAAGPLRREFDAGQARARRGRLRRPRAAGARPAGGRADPRALGGAVRADHDRRVPGHERGPARDPGGARARQPVRGRRRVPVDLPLPARGRERSSAAARRRSTPCGALNVELPLPRGAAGRAQRRVRAGVRRAVLAAAGRPPASRRWTTTARCGCSRSTRRPARRPSSCLITDTPGLGRASRGRPGRRRRPAVAARRGAPDRATGCGTEVDAGRRAGDIVVLVRATASLRLLEEALEEQGLPTYVVGGRGYWSQEQVRDGLAWLRVLANPHDEEALLTVLSSPVPRRGHRRARPAHRGRPRARQPVGRAPGRATRRSRRLLAAERERAERAPLEVLLERAIVATGYDLADARPARRRPPAREPAQADAAGRRVRARRGPRPARLPGRRRRARSRRGARGRGRARVRGPGRRAADDDPPRQGPRVPGRLRRRPRPPVRRPPLAAARRRATAPPACGWPRSAAATRSPRPPGSASPPTEIEADAEEERRLFYVAMTRARELLILSGGTDVDQVAGARARRPADRLDRPRGRRRRCRAPGEPSSASWDGRARPRRGHELNTPETLPGRGAAAHAPARRAPPQHHGAARRRRRSSRRSRSARGRRRSGSPTRSSPTTRKCGYRFYLQRVLGLPRRRRRRRCPSGEEVAGIDPRTRGSIVHAALEDLDFDARRRPRRPRLADDLELTDEEVEDIRRLVAAFAALPAVRRGSPARARSPARPGSRSRSSPTAPARSCAASSTCSPSSPTARTWSSTTRPTACPRTRRPPTYIARALRDAAARLRARRAPRRRAARRGRLLPARAARRAASPTIYRAADAPELAHRLTTLARGIIDARLSGHGHAAPRAVRRLPRPRRRSAATRRAETLRPPPAPWPGAPARRSSPAGTSPAAGPPPR